MKDQKHQTRLFILFMLSICIPLFIAAAISSQKYAHALKLESASKSRQMINQLTQSVDDYIHTSEKLMDAFANHPETTAFFASDNESLAKGDNLPIHKLLSTISRAQPGLTGVMLLAADGRHLSNNLEILQSAQLTSEPWFKQAINNPNQLQILFQSAISNIRNTGNDDAAANIFLIKAVKTLIPEEGVQQGICLFVIQSKKLREIAFIAAQDQNVSLFLIGTGNSSFISLNDTIIPASAFKSVWSDSEVSNPINKIDNKMYQTVSTFSWYTGWRLVGLFTKDALLKKTGYLRNFSLLLMAGCLFVIGINTFIFTRLLLQQKTALNHLISIFYHEQNKEKKIAEYVSRNTEEPEKVLFRTIKDDTLTIKQATNKQPNSAYVLKACKYLANAYTNPDLALEEVARELQVSAGYLSKLLKQETGYSFIEYLTRLRIEKALQLLDDPAVKIGEVAESTGYRSQHYFSRAFKKITGCSPVQYRQSH